jgi:hypothetical protein
MEYVVGHLPATLNHNQLTDGSEAQAVGERQTALIPALDNRTQRDLGMVHVEVAENDVAKMGAVPAPDQLGVHSQADIEDRCILDQACNPGFNAVAAEANSSPEVTA